MINLSKAPFRKIFFSLVILSCLVGASYLNGFPSSRDVFPSTPSSERGASTSRPGYRNSERPRVSDSTAADTAAARVEAELQTVTDGDTIGVRYGGRYEKVRLIGVDSPESRSNEKSARDSQRSGIDENVIVKLGKEASRHAADILRPIKTVSLEFDKEPRDKFNRLLAYVYLPSGQMLNELMVKDGFAQAVIYRPNLRHSTEFSHAFQEAKAANRGLWADGSNYFEKNERIQ